MTLAIVYLQPTQIGCLTIVWSYTDIEISSFWNMKGGQIDPSRKNTLKIPSLITVKET